MKWLPLSALADVAESRDILISTQTSAATCGQSPVWWPESLRAHLFLQNLRN
ncbi:MAG: hypothetical protein IT428_14930 [Planctomycetaceae bacterium]|nr:hypothetical protein [Planctomycetaceae bacterium]